MTKPIKEVIPREVPREIIPTLNAFADAIDEFVNFGSHLMVGEESVDSNGEENVAPVMLLRHLLDVIDSISLLVREGTGDPAKILARAALETTLHLEYLFEKDTHKRAIAFLVEGAVKQIKEANKYKSNSNEGKATYKTFKDENVLSGFSVPDEDLDELINNKQKMLELPQFKRCYEEYKRLVRTGKRNPAWYSYYDGPATIETLAKHLKKKSLYEIIYRKWSGSVHGSDIYLNKLSRTNDTRIEIVQLRYVKDVQEVVQYTLIMALTAFRVFINARMKHKENEFAQWYLQIRPTYNSILEKQWILIE